MNYLHALTLITQGGNAAEKGMKIIFEEFYPRFKKFFLYKGLYLAQAEDLASDSLSKIFYSLCRKEYIISDPSTFSSWADTVAKNTMKDHLRKVKNQRKNEVCMDNIGHVDDEKNEANFLESIADCSQLDIVTRLCFIQQIKRFIAAYPENASWVERMVYNDESMTELSQTLGRTVGATREYLSQCKKRLYQYLRECLL